MKKITIILLIILSSCSRNEFEKKLLGNWNNHPSEGMTDFMFYTDSVVSTERYFTRTGKWKANDSIIYLKFPKTHEGLRENIVLNYKLFKDSLMIKNNFDSIYTISTLYKVNSYWKHYLRELKMDINLPKADFELIKNDAVVFGIDLYIGFKDKKLIINHFRKNIDLVQDIDAIVFSERAVRKENEEKYLFFNLIVDNKINEYRVDSLKKILNRFPEMKIFRVYKNDTANYGKYDLTNTGEHWNWYGRFE